MFGFQGDPATITIIHPQVIQRAKLRTPVELLDWLEPESHLNQRSETKKEEREKNIPKNFVHYLTHTKNDTQTSTTLGLAQISSRLQSSQFLINFINKVKGIIYFICDCCITAWHQNHNLIHQSDCCRINHVRVPRRSSKPHNNTSSGHIVCEARYSSGAPRLIRTGVPPQSAL